MSKIKKGDLIKLTENNYFVRQKIYTTKDIFRIFKYYKTIYYCYDDSGNVTTEIDYIDEDIYVQKGTYKTLRPHTEKFWASPITMYKIDIRPKEIQIKEKIKELWERQPYFKEGVKHV
jgi:hypothetical protein